MWQRHRSTHLFDFASPRLISLEPEVPQWLKNGASKPPNHRILLQPSTSGRRLLAPHRHPPPGQTHCRREQKGSSKKHKNIANSVPYPSRRARRSTRCQKEGPPLTHYQLRSAWLPSFQSAHQLRHSSNPLRSEFVDMDINPADVRAPTMKKKKRGGTKISIRAKGGE